MHSFPCRLFELFLNKTTSIFLNEASCIVFLRLKVLDTFTSKVFDAERQAMMQTHIKKIQKTSSLKLNTQSN